MSNGHGYGSGGGRGSGMGGGMGMGRGCGGGGSKGRGQGMGQGCGRGRGMGRGSGTTPLGGSLLDQPAQGVARLLGSVVRGILGSDSPGTNSSARTPQLARQAPRQVPHVRRVAEKIVAVIDREQCTGCEVCIGLCPEDAIRLDDIVATVDLAKCTGCGSCIETCPNHAISLSDAKR
jgi:ferredoxin